ncbi:hypothetical protein AcW1_005575 [Taiwanofungus camphoratus]|nr:hypothetical protein AcV7_009113 [Antrodia cinnamomea]KAI0957070.1 hypothetical protein AcW1_005575 [Antrodia cinnamomea]
MMIVDMMAYAIDTPAPATIVLISGDRDFAYAVSVLSLRRYRVILIAPSVAHDGLKGRADVVYHWPNDVLPKMMAASNQKAPFTKGAKGHLPSDLSPGPILQATMTPSANISAALPSLAVQDALNPGRPTSPLVQPGLSRWRCLQQLTPRSTATKLDSSDSPLSLSTPCSYSTSICSDKETTNDQSEDIGTNRNSDFMLSEELRGPSEPREACFAEPPDSVPTSRGTVRDPEGLTRPDPFSASISVVAADISDPGNPTFAEVLRNNLANVQETPGSVLQTENTERKGPAGSGNTPQTGPVPAEFIPLVRVLRRQLKAGVSRVAFAQMGSLLLQESAEVYKRAGVTKLSEYTALAEEAKIVVQDVDFWAPGGMDGNRWVRLHPRFSQVIQSKSKAKPRKEWIRSGTNKW